MATNPYFDSQFSEEPGNLDSELYRDLIDEMIQNKGRDVYYLPRTLENFDSFFMEDSHPSSFNDAKVIEMYMENVEEWTGQQEIYSKFGLEIRDQASMIVSRRRFGEEITAEFPDVSRPREGDVIVMHKRYDKRVRAFEITWVDKEAVFYQLGDLPIYRLTIRNFEYSGEEFNTGIEDIDSYTPTYSLMTTINLGVGTGTFVIGETVENGAWSADLIASDAGVITVTNTKGELNNILPIVGVTSGASYAIAGLATNVKNDSDTNDNDFIRENDDVDFSESNPFSGF